MRSALLGLPAALLALLQRTLEAGFHLGLLADKLVFRLLQLRLAFGGIRASNSAQ